MLLVKSKELKNSSKFSLIQRGCCLFTPLFLLSFPSFSQDKAPESIGPASNWLSVFMSLLLVVGVIFMLGYLMRRFNVTHSGSGQMQVVSSLMAGARERIVVVQVGEEQHLIGITAQNINHLARLDTPISPDNTGEKFRAKFQGMLKKQQTHTDGE